MEISKIQNNYSFKGLNYKQVCPDVVKRLIKPQRYALEDLAKDFDITLKSSSYMRKAKHFQTPTPSLDITITPKDEIYSNIPVSQNTMLLSKETESEDLFDLIKTIIRNVF